MAYQQLWFFVEGSDDKRFIEIAVCPEIKNKFDFIRIIEYAQMPRKTLYAYLHSINSIPHSDYVFLRDINSAPCVTQKKEDIHELFNQRIAYEKIFVVIKEIESWYLAGLDNTQCELLEIESFLHTNNLSKEQFNALVPNRFDSRDDFMIEILKSYSVETAKTKNTSFNYFFQKRLNCG